MSTESAAKFLERMASDDAFAKAVSGNKDWYKVAEVAGFSFTREEFDEARRERQALLSEEELDEISGGNSVGCYTGLFQPLHNVWGSSQTLPGSPG